MRFMYVYLSPQPGLHVVCSTDTQDSHSGEPGGRSLILRYPDGNEKYQVLLVLNNLVILSTPERKEVPAV